MIVPAGKPSRRAEATAAWASDLPSRAAFETVFRLGVEPSVEEHEKSESRGLQGLPFPRPGVGLLAGRMVEPETGVGKRLAQCLQVLVSGIVVAVETEIGGSAAGLAHPAVPVLSTLGEALQWTSARARCEAVMLTRYRFTASANRARWSSAIARRRTPVLHKHSSRRCGPWSARPARNPARRYGGAASFFWITPRMNSANSSSEAPRRIWPCRSWSQTENRQVRILPSEVMRMRLQCPQKGCDTGAMMPISPMPSSKR